ncbi:hypothetical protein Tco_0261225 [Tanacetum coccineum]
MIEGSGSAFQKAKNVEEGVESVTWQAAVLVPDGLTFHKGGRMNCGHTAYGMVQSDIVPGWSELLLEHAYSDSQDYCLLDMDCQFQLQTIEKKQEVFDSILYETGSVGDDTNNNKGGNAPIAISSSRGSEVDLDSGVAELAVAAGVFSNVEPTNLNSQQRPTKAVGTVGYIDPENYGLNVVTGRSERVARISNGPNAAYPLIILMIGVDCTNKLAFIRYLHYGDV